MILSLHIIVVCHVSSALGDEEWGVGFLFSTVDIFFYNAPCGKLGHPGPMKTIQIRLMQTGKDNKISNHSNHRNDKWK